VSESDLTGGAGKGYALHFETAGCGNGYTLHVHTVSVGGCERDTQCTSKLVVDSDTPCMSIDSCCMMVLFLIYDIEKSYLNA
jgi:hypothetical protein